MSTRSRPLPLAAGLLLFGLAGCATSEARLPVCDAKHRRPANPHGSVLAGGSPPPAGSAASTAEPASRSAPKQKPAAEREVSGLDPRAYGACGGGL